MVRRCGAVLLFAFAFVLGACDGGSTPSLPEDPPPEDEGPDVEGTATVSTHTGEGRSDISPYVYGVSQAQSSGNDFTVRRLGGNRLTGYNWRPITRMPAATTSIRATISYCETEGFRSLNGASPRRW
jgi:hypothetical protein